MRTIRNEDKDIEYLLEEIKFYSFALGWVDKKINVLDYKTDIVKYQKLTQRKSRLKKSLAKAKNSIDELTKTPLE